MRKRTNTSSPGSNSLTCMESSLLSHLNVPCYVLEISPKQLKCIISAIFEGLGNSYKNLFEFIPQSLD